jgi:hypothetical protein
VPASILYDNTKLAVARILGDGTRQRTRVFSELQSHYLFADRFGRPAWQPNGMVGKGRQRRFAPAAYAPHRGAWISRARGATESHGRKMRPQFHECRAGDSAFSFNHTVGAHAQHRADRTIVELPSSTLPGPENPTCHVRPSRRHGHQDGDAASIYFAPISAM